MLWHVEIRPAAGEVDRDAMRVAHEAHALGADTVKHVRSARVFLLQGQLAEADVAKAARSLLVDNVVETFSLHRPDAAPSTPSSGERAVHVLFKPGVTDNVAQSTQKALVDLGFDVENVATGRSYWFGLVANRKHVDLLAARVLANDAIERVIEGPLALKSLEFGSNYEFDLVTIPLRGLSLEQLEELSRTRQLSLSRDELQTIQQHFVGQERDPTDIELETIAQTWSEHCSHKTLKGRIHYRDERGERRFENMLRETVFAATEVVRHRFGNGRLVRERLSATTPAS